MTERIYYFDTIKGFTNAINAKLDDFKKEGNLLYMEFVFSNESFQTSPTQNIPRAVINIRISTVLNDNLHVLRIKSFHTEAPDLMPIAMQALKETAESLRENINADVKIINGGIYTPIEDRDSKVFNIQNVIELEKLKKDIFGEAQILNNLSSIFNDIEPAQDDEDLDEEDLEKIEKDLETLFNEE